MRTRPYGTRSSSQGIHSGAASPLPANGGARRHFEVSWNAVRNINWKLIAFISVMFWLIYSAPTEDSITTWLFHGHSRAAAYDDF
jgi:hypothetical protein